MRRTLMAAVVLLLTGARSGIGAQGGGAAKAGGTYHAPGSARGGRRPDAAKKTDAPAATAAEEPSRYWSPFSPLPIPFDYVCPALRGDQLEMWMACDNWANRSESILINQAIAKAGRENPAVAFSTQIVRDFPDRADPSRPAAVVRLSRAAVYAYPGKGYVALFAAFAGDPYAGGQHPLLPILFSSPTGKPGDWVYHGRLAGEPEKVEHAQRIWSDGGGIVPLPNGNWRAYANGYGVTLAACEAKSLDGPWTFVRDRRNQIRDIAAVLPVKQRMRGGATFPFILRVSDHEYHLWMSDQWEVTAVWHLSSADGLDFPGGIAAKTPPARPGQALRLRCAPLGWRHLEVEKNQSRGA